MLDIPQILDKTLLYFTLKQGQAASGKTASWTISSLQEIRLTTALTPKAATRVQSLHAREKLKRINQENRINAIFRLTLFIPFPKHTKY